MPICYDKFVGYLVSHNCHEVMDEPWRRCTVFRRNDDPSIEFHYYRQRGSNYVKAMAVYKAYTALNIPPPNMYSDLECDEDE